MAKNTPIIVIDTHPLHIREPMGLQASFSKRTFHFSFNARTSRGTMKQRDSWFLKIWDSNHPEVFGMGEAAPVSGLSGEKASDVHQQLTQVASALEAMPAGTTWTLDEIHERFSKHSLCSSVYLAVETALLDLANGGRRLIFDNAFVKGNPVEINGLVWMGGLDFMLQQVSIKMEEGFGCIKLKIGGLNFEKELDILQFIRRKYFRDQLTLRLDANGAFKADQAMYKLMDLAQYDVESIEQPLKAGSTFLPELCKKSPIPIALDEELLGLHTREAKIEMLDRAGPQFLVLKPTLQGGFFGCREWIQLADERKIGWWLTSSMESNLGLNALAQFASQYPLPRAQGLGTGTIFKDNIPSPLHVEKGKLSWNSKESWDLSEED
jgi:O-succinylbenzoate synthase